MFTKKYGFAAFAVLVFALSARAEISRTYDRFTDRTKIAYSTPIWAGKNVVGRKSVLVIQMDYTYTGKNPAPDAYVPSLWVTIPEESRHCWGITEKDGSASSRCDNCPCQNFDLLIDGERFHYTPLDGFDTAAEYRIPKDVLLKMANGRSVEGRLGSESFGAEFALSNGQKKELRQFLGAIVP